MSGANESEGPVDIQALAAQMLGWEEEETEETTEESQPAGHPAWQEILNKVPQEYHEALLPTLQGWDAGVSRRFQKIHDEYSPYKEIAEEYENPQVLRDAMGFYNALQENPQATWETLGRVYGLSPQHSQANSDNEEDVDFDDLPASVRNRLSKIDEHDQMLAYMSQQMLNSQAATEEAQEDAALEEVLHELYEEYGDYDEDYVVGLIAGGVDPEEAVLRFQQNYGYEEEQPRRELPRVMSSGGGVPSLNSVDVNGLSNQDTQSLIAEILRYSQDS